MLQVNNVSASNLNLQHFAGLPLAEEQVADAPTQPGAVLLHYGRPGVRLHPDRPGPAHNVYPVTTDQPPSPVVAPDGQTRHQLPQVPPELLQTRRCRPEHEGAPGVTSLGRHPLKLKVDIPEHSSQTSLFCDV